MVPSQGTILPSPLGLGIITTVDVGAGAGMPGDPGVLVWLGVVFRGTVALVETRVLSVSGDVDDDSLHAVIDNVSVKLTNTMVLTDFTINSPR